MKSLIHLLFMILVAVTVCSCAKPRATYIESRVFWPVSPAKPLLEFEAAYYAQKSIISRAYSSLPNVFEGADEIILSRASGVASDATGRVFISDTVQRCVFVFDFINRFARIFNLENVLDKPTGMAIGPDGRLFVADVGRKRVLVFDRDGNHLFSIGDEKQFQRPIGVAINAALNRIYVSDARKHVISVFSLKGEYLFEFGGQGREDGKLSMPHGIKFSKDGKLYVADMLNARIQVFNTDGVFVGSIGDRAPYQLELEYPRDIAFSSDGNLHIVDIKRALLVSCEPNGRLLLVTGGAGHTSNILGMSSPTGIVMGEDDTIYIVDQLNNRLTLWKYLGAS